MDIAGKVVLTSRFLKRNMETYNAQKVGIEALKVEVCEDGLTSLEKASR